MRSNHLQITVIMALFTLICGPLAPPAAAQSDAELRQENQQLKKQVDDLSSDLEIARRRIADLERQVQQLSDAMERAGRSSSEQPPQEPGGEVTIDESKPDASPRAFYAAIKREYEDVNADLDKGESGDAKRIAYFRILERWVNAANRKHKTKIEWHVKFFERPLSPNPDPIKLLAIDPVTHTVLGEPFFVPVTRQLARQLHRIENREELNIFVLRGVLTPRLRFRENTTDTNSFNPSRLVGPYVTFDFTIEPLNFLPTKENEEDEDAG